MPFRVTNNSYRTSLTAQIAVSQQRLLTAQERVSSGKRINRLSDDPSGAAAVLRLRNSQTAIEQFSRNAGAVKDRLMAGEGSLNDYELALDRTRTLLTQAASDFTTGEQRSVIATELETLRTRMIGDANSRSDGYYIFGGTRQNAPPFDANGVAATTATSPTEIQIEPNAPPIVAGVTAESIFSDTNGTIFDSLASAITALRGTGDPAADNATIRAAFDRQQIFSQRAGQARAQIGVRLNQVESATERLNRNSLALESSVQNIEAVDFAEAALELADAGRALEAALQSGSYIGKRSLLDFLS